MSVYRRSLWGMLKGIIGAPLAGVLVFFVLNMFVRDPRIQLGVPVLVMLAILYISIFSENVRFEVDGDGTFRYYKKGKLRETYRMEDCVVGYRRSSDGGLFASHDINLQVLTADGRETFIDCSPIGPRRFEQMYQQLRAHTSEGPEVLSAK